MNDLRNTPLGQLLFLSALMGGASLVEDTATGNPVVFSTEVSKPLVSLIANFLPVQAGTGDPSPDNVRPITGWTGVNVSHSGKNVLQGVVKNLKNLSGNNGVFTNTATDTRSNAQIRIEAYNGNTYLGQFANKSISTPKIITTVLDTTSYPTMNRLMITHYGSSKDFEALYEWVLPKGKYTLQFNLTGADVQTVGGFSFDSVMVEVGEVTPSTYEPYNGTVYPATFPSTIYGGYVDMVTGEVWATWPEIASYDGETLPGRWLSDRDVYSAGSTPTTGAQVVYELASPVIITTLTPQQINAIKGNNTVWSDANSDCSVTFLKKGT